MLCMCLYPHATVGRWSELVFPSHYMGPGYQTQVIRLGWGQMPFSAESSSQPSYLILYAVLGS